MGRVSFRGYRKNALYALDMIKQILKYTTATAAAALFAASIGSTATASPTDEAPVVGEFNLTIENNNGSVLTHDFNCLELGDDNTAILNACTQLHEADGFIENIPAAQGACAQILDPVTLTATGTWNGEERTYSQEFSNPCMGNLETGGFVFNFS